MHRVRHALHDPIVIARCVLDQQATDPRESVRHANARLASVHHVSVLSASADIAP